MTRPRRKAAPPRTIDALRGLCLAFPEAAEKETWDTPTFRVRNKMFAMYIDNRSDGGHVAIWCKAPPGVQEILVGAAPQKFFRPPYVGHNGWIGVNLDVDLDWAEIAGILDDSYRMTAPKRLLAAMDRTNPPVPADITRRARGAAAAAPATPPAAKNSSRAPRPPRQSRH